MAKYTITYKDGLEEGGWTSFWSFHPDWMLGINNRFLSFKEGQLWMHDDIDSNLRNNFYGIPYSSTIKFVINDASSDVKVAKSIALESNKAMDVEVTAYLADETVSVAKGSILAEEFEEREGQFYAYLRGNELSTDTTSKANYGLGRVSSVATSVLTMSGSLPDGKLAEGDKIYDISGTYIGVVQSYDRDANTITVDTTPTIIATTFIYGQKNRRVDGGEIRGYNFEVELTDKTDTRTELFAASSELFKSFH